MNIKKIIPMIALALMIGCQADQKSITTHSAVTGLSTFENCDALADFLKAKGGKEKPMAPTFTDAAEGEDAYSPSAGVKQTAVEEADIVKREGDRLYILSSDRLVIYDVSQPSEPKKLGELNILAAAQEIYVEQQIVAVIGLPLYPAIYVPGKIQKSFTNVTLIDVSDASTPKKIRELSLPGNYSDSRKVGSAIYLTLTESLPNYDQGRLHEILKEPSSCREIYVPSDLDNGSYGRYPLWHLTGISLTDIDSKPTQTSVIGSWNSVIYATPEHLYLTSYSFESQESGIYLFDLDPSTAAVSPRAYNFIPGSVVNQFSMDESNGVFRIASTVLAPTQTVNYMSTFKSSDGSLDLLGQIDAIVPGESVTAVRFLGDTAYVSTAIFNFDPLVTVDLSNSAQPRIIGQLELPGVTNYLQAWGEDRLIAIGSQGGFSGGVILNLFDISDLAHPKLIEQEMVEGANFSEAQREHLAFSFFEDKKIVAFPVTETGGNSLRIFSVNRDTGFTAIGSITHDDLYPSESYSPSLRRSLDISNLLYSISDAALKVTPFLNLSTDLFGELLRATCCDGAICFDCMEVPF